LSNDGGYADGIADRDQGEPMKAPCRHAAAAIFSLMMPALIVSAFGTNAFAEHPNLEDVLRAWESRQESFKSVRIAWTENRTDPKGALDESRRRKGQPAARPVPPEDTTLRSKCTLLVAGNRSYYSFFGPVWQPDLGVLITRKHKSTFDGETLTSFIGYGDAQVLTDRKSRNRDVALVENRALAWYFWPLRSKWGGLARDDLALSERTEELDDAVLAVLEERHASGPGRGSWWKYWIEPGEGFLVRRARAYNPTGAVDWQIDYEADEAGIRFPSRWKVLTLRNGKQSGSRVCIVSEIAVNPPVADDDFRIELPEDKTLSKDAE
jgi:hypothetical protein